MPQHDLTGAILTLVIAAVILLAGTYVASSTLSATTSGGQTVSATALLDGTSYTVLGDHIGRDERVVNSRGFAINTTGADDSYFQSQQSIEIAGDDTWTVSLWARADSDATTRNMTVLSLNGRVIITYNGTRGMWRAWYYDDGSTSSYNVSVSAPSPNSLTNVIVTRNETTLAIYRNTTRGTTENVTEVSSVDASLNTSNWDGRVDEVRTFDDSLTAGERDSVYNSPVAPLTGTNRTARVMFDEPGRDVQLLFFAPGGIDTNNVTYSDGLDGSVMDAGRFAVMGADYKWQQSGPKIKAIEGGELDGAPVAYVTYTRTSRLDTLADDWTAAVGLAGVAFVVLPLAVILVYLRGVRRT